MINSREPENRVSHQLELVSTTLEDGGQARSQNEHDEDATPYARGGTLRVVAVSLLAIVFGYDIPIIDVKLSNTFLGAAHLPPDAVGALLLLLLVVNPLLRLVSQQLKFSRNEVLTVYITCLFSTLVPGHGGKNFFVGSGRMAGTHLSSTYARIKAYVMPPGLGCAGSLWNSHEGCAK
ncbi:MAG TPA: DUF6785 family protein [Abditibacteriaceae bacterium]|jgi:hypothetical protein